MPRKTPKIKITEDDKSALIKQTSSRTQSKQTVDRAKMILDSAEGKPVKQIAAELQTYPNKIIYWRKRYIEFGIKGLQDKPRSGCKRRLKSETVRRSVENCNTHN